MEFIIGAVIGGVIGWFAGRWFLKSKSVVARGKKSGMDWDFDFGDIFDD